MTVMLMGTRRWFSLHKSPRPQLDGSADNIGIRAGGAFLTNAYCTASLFTSVTPRFLLLVSATFLNKKIRNTTLKSWYSVSSAPKSLFTVIVSASRHVYV
jgi:hypothetical protein